VNGERRILFRNVVPLENQKRKTEHVVSVPMSEEEMLNLSWRGSDTPQLWKHRWRRIDEDFSID